MRNITMGWRYLDQLPVPLLALAIGLGGVLLGTSAWLWGIQPWWQENRLLSHRSHRLSQQVGLAQRAIVQIPMLTRRLAAQRSLTPTTLSTQITKAAVSSQVFISDLTETDSKHAQATLLGSFAQLQAFLQMQSRQWSP